MRRVSSVLFRTFAAARGGSAARFHKARFYGSTTGGGGAILRRWFYTPEVPHHSLPYDLILYQCEYFPKCNVVTAILDYYGIRYKVVEVSPVSMKEIRWSEYRWVPILILHGEQLNGSSAIMDKLGKKILSKERPRAESISYVQETKWLHFCAAAGEMVVEGDWANDRKARWFEVRVVTAIRVCELEVRW